MGEVEIRWRKSSHSGGNGGECVQAAAPGGGSGGTGPAGLLLVRDSTDPGGPVLAFGARQWRAFTAGMRAGRS